MSDQPSASQILDGYRLIRFLGRGGFGEVWLCRSDAMGGYHALKFISGIEADLLDKEHHSLGLYRSAAARLRSPHLVPIEHINRHAAGLYYVMPLADGVAPIDPAEPNWQPLSLASLIEARASAATWFSSQEIIGLIRPILDALQTLSDAGLVHRDVKPENILFFNGQPCLGDISLLGEDAAVITRRGTPGYATPSWYVGGHPDMYGVAATLYTLLTGNVPDKMGRAVFLWPPQGEGSFSESERAEWKRLHRVIRRATEEQVAERYVDFRNMAAALAAPRPAIEPPPLPGPRVTSPVAPVPPARKTPVMAWLIAGAVFFLVAIGANSLLSPPPADASNRPEPQPASDPTSPVGTSTTNPAVSQSGISESAYEDAQTAHDSLTSVVQHFGMPFEQNNLYQRTLAQIQSHIWDKDSFDPQQAARKLDLCLNAIDGLRKVPNVRLARMLLFQAAGDRTSAEDEIGDPVFTSPGSDNLGYRIVLLCRLHAADKAETLLDRVLEAASESVRKKSEALMQRAEVRIQLGKFAEANKDVTNAIAATKQDTALKAGVEMKQLGLESDYPAYAAYLKANPGK